MTTLEDLLRENLGLGTTLQLLFEATLPDDGVGYGHGAAAPRLDLGTVVDNPMPEQVDFKPANENGVCADLPFEVGRDLTDARIVIVRTRLGTVRALRGHSRTMPNGLLLVDEDEPAAALVSVSSGLFVVDVHRRMVRVLGVHQSDDANWTSLDDWRPDLGSDVFQNLPIESVLEGWQCSPWLREALDGLAQAETVVERAASLGLMGRLWEPASADERRDLEARPDCDPNERVLSLIRNVPESSLDRVEQLARTRALYLLEMLNAVERAPDEAERLRLARELALRRDDLESVFFVLVQRDRGRQLGQVLEQVDDEATSAWSALPVADSLRDDPRLSQVALLEPDAWWGLFGEV